jgi:arsenite-transporting ATPase
MRIVLFTGKGGVGKTTTAGATAVRLADRGVKTLLVSTDAAHSAADALDMALDGEPTDVVAGLQAVQVNTQQQFEESWQEVQRYLRTLLDQGGLAPVAAEELTVLPGIDEVLALLAVRDLAGQGRWDAIVLDCAPTAETVRLLALPEALGWYLRRVFPVHRALARGLRPVTGLLGRGVAIPPEAVFDAAVRLTDELAAVRLLLADPQITTVRLVLTPEAVVAAEARRTLTALSLYGYRVDGVVVNRIFPDSPRASCWQRGWLASQADQLAAIAESFGGLPLRRMAYRSAEPVGVPALRAVADDLYGVQPGADPIRDGDPEPLMTVEAAPRRAPEDPEYLLTLRLPLASRSDVDASRVGDELVVTVAGHRRLLSLPSVLRRCVVTGGAVEDGRLVVRFRPDPQQWRSV